MRSSAVSAWARQAAAVSLRPWIANGYLMRGAGHRRARGRVRHRSRGADRHRRTTNRDAAEGADLAFGRGGSPYNRVQGDAGHAPNPCVRPLGPGPFYAVRIHPGSLGTFVGLDADADARVLGADGRPIPGLYAAGNDMASMMRGRYPAGGITLGPGMTFGYIAAHHAAAFLSTTTGAALISRPLSLAYLTYAPLGPVAVELAAETGCPASASGSPPPFRAATSRRWPRIPALLAATVSPCAGPASRPSTSRS